MRLSVKIKEYIWLVNTIYRARRITFAEIQEKWRQTDMSDGQELARSTFARHKDAIESMFGILINCDRQNEYVYYIGNPEVLREDSVQNWMLSTLSVNNIISESLSLQKRIILEPVSYEEDYLPMVIDAMKRNVRLKVKYRKYGDEEPRDLDFEPYCLKLFRQRWYILGHFHRKSKADKPAVDYFGMFSFDRIIEMSLTSVKFEMDPDFDAEEFFHNSYGALVNDNTQPVKIIIRVYGYERFYVKDLPIHQSQREIGQGDDYTDFELFVRPTPDFVRHIVGLSDSVRVLSPDWFVDEVANEHYSALTMYDEDSACGREEK